MSTKIISICFHCGEIYYDSWIIYIDMSKICGFVHNHNG